MDKVRLTGTAGAEIQAVMDLAPDGLLNLSGRIFTDRFRVSMDTLLALGPIGADVPVAVTLDPAALRVVSSKSLPLLDPQDYALHRDAYLGRLPGLGRIQIDSLTVQGLTVGPMTVDTRIQGSQVELPWITLAGIGGNLAASAHVAAQGGRLDSLSYGLSLDVARVNSAALLRQIEGGGQESELNATARFSGQGIDFAREVDVSGYFYITRIGPRFASTLAGGHGPPGQGQEHPVDPAPLGHGLETQALLLRDAPRLCLSRPAAGPALVFAYSSARGDGPGPSAPGLFSANDPQDAIGGRI